MAALETEDQFIPEDLIPDALTSDRITGMGATFVVYGAAIVANYLPDFFASFTNTENEASKGAPVMIGALLLGIGKTCLEIAADRRRTADMIRVTNHVVGQLQAGVEPGNVDINIHTS